jgi:DNA-binding response OmpR family regulator
MNHICPTCNQAVHKPENMLCDLETGIVSYAGRKVKLTPRQAEILYLMWESYPQTATRDHIINRINGRYGYDFGGDTLKVHVSRIRKMLADMPLQISKFGRDGYRLMMGAECQ